ncbi:unnamed protein product [Cyprideis torosa]|uniref:Uncharacterized protein n=1 Tax=Cyprideis torosa TaxID=163714 RepID=A0A7R8WK02_9CRUS|nr:unnamed protein product [Cyprideis torosa]CAG0900784.1 unnamed protein product [Cyprideis torosa]
MLAKREEVDRAEHKAGWSGVGVVEEERRRTIYGVTGPLPWPIDRPFPGWRPHGHRNNPPANYGVLESNALLNHPLWLARVEGVRNSLKGVHKGP